MKRDKGLEAKGKGEKRRRAEKRGGEGRKVFLNVSKWYVCHVCKGPLGGQKAAYNLLERELPLAVNHLM